MFIHFLHHHDRRTFGLSQNAVVQIQAEQIVSPDNNIGMPDRNHPEIILLSQER